MPMALVVATCRAKGSIRILDTYLRPHASTLKLSAPCNYHSQNRQPEGPFTSAQTAILSAALVRVPTHGFTPKAIELGVADAGFPHASKSTLVRGQFDLVHYHLLVHRRALRRFAASLDSRTETRTKLETLVLQRLFANAAIIRHLQQALAIMALPPHAPIAFGELSKLSDELLWLAGDPSNDTAWYAKRAALATVYSSAELFMTRDTSSHFIETKRFLRTRLNDADQVGGAIAGAENWLAFAAKAGVNVLRSKSFRI